LQKCQAQRISGTDVGTLTAVRQRRQLYSGPLSKLRTLMICRMAKPEEVLIVEDENGNIVRETLKDNDVLVQYKVSKSIMAVHAGYHRDLLLTSYYCHLLFYSRS